ncbi:hypothetical protein GALMADRAFT_258050 [Galerina marginata CBS 339.88]|uniref:Adenylate cyclase n=1 Tax=Galerina marginata (strain CBS 339.88) TaxID=685588 RepID=A0A067S9G7_GALM3|nr:hypothetical protein GALMADRAFT_258050 [Galerina marginata CBS 339.88]
MDRRDSTIRLSSDAVDQNGVARFADASHATLPNDDSEIAPWLDLPPTPPPKNNTSRSFGFVQKSSLASFVSLRQNSTTSLLRNARPLDSQSTLYVPERQRRSQDDDESSKSLVYSGSSSHSGDLRRAKSSLNLFAKLKNRPSKAHLRTDSDDSEHPSLKAPVPPLPEQRHTNTLFNVPIPISHPGASTSTLLIPLSAKKDKLQKAKKKNSQTQAPPSSPPKIDGQEYTGDLDLKSMDGIVDFNIASAGPSSSIPNGGPSSGRGDPSSPSSGFDSSQSYSDHSSLHQHHYFLPSSEFSDPFSTTPLQDKRKAIIPAGDYRKVSPKTMMPPAPPDSLYRNGSVGLAVPPSSTGPGSPTWVPPESWAVEKGSEDPYNNPEVSETHDSGSEADSVNGYSTASKRKVGDKPRHERRARNPASASFSSMASTTSWSSRTTLRGSQQLPYGFTYKMRVYRPNNTYHVIAIDLETTVADLIAKLNRKLLKGEERVQHNLYLKEQGRERMLGQHERPAAIVKLRMEQAGYDIDDGQHLLGAESLGILLKFVYKSQLLAGEEQIALEHYDFVDLSGRGLRTIPVVLHQNADSIISLRLDRNPMLEIPLDFIQSCTTLRELRLTNMSMKKVPQSLRHSTTLHRLILSSNCIRDMDDAYLDHIQGLLALFLQNNRLDKLPWHFPRLRTLVTLNISNNKFTVFPIAVTQLESLRDLDISFNTITELPEEIGKMITLERFIMVGNQITRFPDEAVALVNLRGLDCRRNQISDLSLICMLPNLETLSADHNTLHALDLSLGPRLNTLDASHNDITQISLVPGPMGKPPYALTLLDLSYAKLSSLDDLALGQLSSLRTLKLDHNSIRSIPDTLGDLKWLETLSCTDNKLDALPSTIGKLQKLETLDAHNNSLTELPQMLWNCASLQKINVTSNFIGSWHDPPVLNQESTTVDGNLAVPRAAGRKSSSASINSTRALPPLVHSLEKLYIGENCLTDNVIQPLMIFKALQVLNMSFNEIQDLPPAFFRNMTLLEELYLSGNKLTSIPAEDFPRLTKLTTLYLNGNRLLTLPQELGKVSSLTVLDVGSNFLKYNINNWEFDWNWNFNTNLKYLNLSGNKRLQIKADTPSSRMSRHIPSSLTLMLSGFTNLSQLRVLGLMDVTITTTSKDTAIDIPDENADRRVRTSLSTVCGMGYGIADSLGKNDYLNMIDLVHEFHGRKDEALFAMFGRTHPSRTLKPGTSPNRLSKFLHDNFVNVFRTQLAVINEKMDRDGNSLYTKKDGIKKALHWTFLKLNQDLREVLVAGPRKNSHASMQTISESQYSRMGVSGIALYFMDKTIYAANVGDALAVVSRQGVCHEISKKHDPYDRLETARIRAAEGSISPPGLVNDEVDVSRSFGFYHLFPPITARPEIFTYDLTEMDEFVIIANRGLWDFVPYQTAVDIARTVARTARTERPDPMLAAQKLRDFAISYGADGSTMIMVIWVADLFNSPSRSRQPTLDSIVDPETYRTRKKGEVRDKLIDRLFFEVAPPTGHITIVFTDIRNSTHLWETNPGMPTAMKLHNGLLRRQLRFCGGYEVKTEGDSFMCSFPTTLSAVWWCLTVQVQLLQEPWPLEILDCEDGKQIFDAEGRLIARGLSVRMGIHSGMPLCETDLITNRMDYFGPMVNRSARINSSALGGQIMCSMDIIREINAKVLEIDEETEYSKLQSPQAIEAIRGIGVVIMPVGEVKLKGIELPEILSILYPSGLDGRHELKETPSEPAPPGSKVQFTASELWREIRQLGLVCLRLEALTSGRVFQPLPSRKASIQSNPDTKDPLEESKIFYGDVDLLLPNINDHSSDLDCFRVVDSLLMRISNTLIPVEQRFGTPSALHPSNPTADSLMTKLMQDGALDQDTLEYIASVLNRR